MVNAQRLSFGFPFPVYVNETQTKQRLAPGVYVDEAIAAPAAGHVFYNASLDGLSSSGPFFPRVE